MSLTTRFQQRLPTPKYVPSSSTETTGQYPPPTLGYEEWLGVEDTIIADTNSWLDTQAQGRVYLPPQEHESNAYSETAVATQLAGQVAVVQKALNQASLGAEWLQEPRKGTGGQAPRSRADRGDATSGPPVEGLEVEGGGLLNKPDFELLQGGVYKAFLEAKVP